MRLRKSDIAFAAEVARAINDWEKTRNPLPGLLDQRARDCFIAQLVASDRTRRFIEHYRSSHRLTVRQMDPNSGVFSPFAAAVLHHKSGDHDEALWLVFLATHFGHHPKAKWRYVENVYGRVGDGRWDWPSVSANVDEFCNWLNKNVTTIKGTGPNGFGNHRKYESLSDSGTGNVVRSYIKWIGPGRNHGTAFAKIANPGIDTPAAQFDKLYQSMQVVKRFGRLGTFDYLSTASRLGLISAVAGRAYLPNSTGPLNGACLLFGISKPRELESLAVEFGFATNVSYGVLEDALCNWHKSPYRFIHFRG